MTVDGEIIGIADEWADTPRTKKYEFEKEGVHYVKLSHRDYKTIWLRFIVSEKADDKTAEVELEMKKADKDERTRRGRTRRRRTSEAVARPTHRAEAARPPAPPAGPGTAAPTAGAGEPPVPRSSP